MEYKNESGKSLSDIVKEVEAKDKGIQIVLIGMDAGAGSMAATLAHMVASEKFACVHIATLPKTDQDHILSSERKKPFEKGSMDELASKLVNDLRRDAMALKPYQNDDLYVDDINKKPFYQTLPRHKKKKYWKK